MEKKKNNLLLIKEQISDNCDTLLARLEACTGSGMKDYSDTVYNEILDLQEDVGGLENADELAMVVVRAIGIEKKIDRYLSTRGESMLNLEWPLTPIEPPMVE